MTTSKQIAPIVPVTTQPERLPLGDDNFSWERFEAFCRHLISSLPDVKEVHHYGKQGSRQRGIDLVAKLRDGKEWVFQCKQYKKFTDKQASKAVADTTYEADHYILLLACEATSELRDEIKKHSDWSLWDVRDISLKVRTLSDEAARSLVETHFGPHWRSQFLHLPSSELFVTAERFFEPLVNPKNLFNHSWLMVGRDSYGTALHSFTESDQERVLVLTGRGGIGKTKILHHFASEFDTLHPETSLRFTVEGLSLSDESIDSLPTGPCTIVVDDAYRRDDLAGLLAMARRRAARTKIVLAIRPYASERMRSLLTQAGYDAREVVVVDELNDLQLSAVKALAAQALGNPNSRHIPALAAATRDSPLITLVGGRLLAEQAIDIRLLERHDEFRFTVLSRFEDVLVGQVGDRIRPALCRDLLRLLAAVSPFRFNHDTLKEATANHLGISSTELVEVLGILEQSGVLLRRGYTLRITPDVLADHILHRACITTQGEPTGYAEKVFSAFAPICAAQVLSNLSELDWRVHKTTDEGTTLLETIWQSIRAEFSSASNSGRSQILDVLKDAAFYQPRQVLDIVEFALRNPLPPDEGEGWRFYQFTHATVLSKLPELLQRIGYTLEYLPHCCDLLWELGRDDTRQTGPNPTHALRILEDYASYDLDKPISVNKIVVEAVARWLTTADVHDHAHSVFSILNGVLQKSGHSSYTEGHRIICRGFLVSKENTAQVRTRALRLIFDIARSARLAVSLKAIKSLKLALQDPTAYYNMVITKEELENWEPDTLKVLSLFEQLISERSHPLIHLAVIDAVQWHAHLHELTSVRAKASEVMARVPEGLNLRLVRELTNAYDYYIGLNDDDFHNAFEQRQQDINKERQRVVTEFLQEYPDPTNGHLQLETILTEIFAATGKEPQPWIFLHQLASSDAGYAAAMCEAIVKVPESFLATQLSSLLPFVNRANPELALDIVRGVMASKELSLCRSLAAGSGFWASRWEQGVTSDDVTVIRELSEFNDPVVRIYVIRLLPILWKVASREAVEIACCMKITDEVSLVSEMCGILNPRTNQIPPDTLTDEELKKVLTSIQIVSSIDDWQIGSFITYASTRLPKSVAEMLLSRVARSEEYLTFEPLPALGLNHQLEGLRNHPEHKNILRKLRDRILQTGDTLEGHWYLPKLFETVSLQFGQTALDVLNEWIESAEEEKVKAASRLIKEAHPNFIFTEEVFVANLLEKAYAINDDCYREVGGNLMGLAISGKRMGTPGQPFPEDIALRDQSREAAARHFPGSPVYKFYETLLTNTEISIKDQLARDEELIH